MPYDTYDKRGSMPIDTLLRTLVSNVYGKSVQSVPRGVFVTCSFSGSCRAHLLVRGGSAHERKHWIVPHHGEDPTLDHAPREESPRSRTGKYAVDELFIF